jgi:hypothetical protein
MVAEDIIRQIKNGGVSVTQSSYRTALVHLLRKCGYRSKDIATALGIRNNNVDYYYNKSLDFVDCNDKPFMAALNDLEEHEIVLIPYFVARMGKYCVKTYLTIDNIKL